MGGTERVTLATIDVLSTIGWEVDLYVLARFNPAELAPGFGSAARTCYRIRTTKVPEFLRRAEMLRRGGVYLNLFRSFMEKRVEDCDIFFDMAPFTSLGPTYFRLPDLVYWNLAPIDLDVLYSTRYGVLGELYAKPFRALLRHLLKRWKLIKVHVANSEFIRNVIINRLDGGLKPLVIYPPVDIDRWTVSTGILGPRTGIASFARFDAWKRHDLQVRMMQGLESHLKMIGRAIKDIEVTHLEWLKAAARNDVNVQFCVNLPQTEVKRLLSSSKVFIHTADAEPFGITIVEAIAAGCIPIVRDDGGTREIVPFEELRFETIEEGREKMRRALKGEYDHLLSKLKEHIRRFDQETFRREMTKTVLRLSNE